MIKHVTRTLLTTFDLDEGFEVDVIEKFNTDLKEFWLYHPECEIKMWMFTERAETIEEMALLINHATQEQIDFYFSTYMGI